MTQPDIIINGHKYSMQSDYTVFTIACVCISLYVAWILLWHYVEKKEKQYKNDPRFRPLIESKSPYFEIDEPVKTKPKKNRKRNK